MTYSVTRIADGNTSDFDITFPFLKSEHVNVYVGGEAAAYSWVNPTRIRTATKPASGTSVRVTRETPREPLYIIPDNRPVPSEWYNALTRQALYVAEENGADPGPLATLQQLVERSEGAVEEVREVVAGVTDTFRTKASLDALLKDTDPQPVGTTLFVRKEGITFEVPAQPRPTDLTTAGGVRLRLQATESVAPSGGTIVPHYHFRQASTVAAPKVVIMGDSISTSAPSFTHDESDSLWGQIKRAFTHANPHLTPTFVNLAWGTRTWSNCRTVVNEQIAAGAPIPNWPYGDGTDTWLNMVKAQQPDILLLGFGMNDRQNFVTSQMTATITEIRGWPKVPDIVLVTPMVPSRVDGTTYAGVEDQEGRYFTAHFMRSWAIYNRVGLLDLHRHYAKVVHGVDPRNTHLVLDGAATTQAVPFTFPNECDQDFGIEITGNGDLINSGLILSVSRAGANSKSEIRFAAQTGKLLIRFANSHSPDGTPASPIDVLTAITVPAASCVLRVFVRDCWCRITLDGAVAYDGPIVRHGGRFNPTLTGMSGPTSATIRTWTGRYHRNAPAISDELMWGWASASAEVIGGNKINHPSSMGAAYVYRPLLDAEDWSIPAFASGATDYTNTMGRNLGIGTDTPRGTLHITKDRTATDPQVEPTANVLVLEGANTGMTLLTAADGTAKMLMGPDGNTDAAGITYAAATGHMKLRAQDKDVVTVINPPTDSLGLQVLVNIGGTFVLKNLLVGAADSGGMGRRVVCLSN